MKSLQKAIALCSVLMLISIVVGFYILAIRQSNVGLGIGVMLFGVIVFGMASFTAAIKMVHLKNQEKEDRIKKLEDEVEALKNKIRE